MKTKTIRAKITIWFSVLFLALVAAVLILLLIIGQSVLKSDTKDKLRAFVESNTEELEYLNSGDEMDDDEGDHYVIYRDGYLEIDDDFCDYKEGMYVSLYYGDELMYGENPIEAYPDVLPFLNGQMQETKYNKEKYFVYDMQVSGENLQGLWLRGIVDEQAGVTMLLRVCRIMILALPVLAFIAVFGGYLLARRALEPLVDICEQAGSINDGSDLSKRIQITNESVETRMLTDTFNQMFDRLLASFDAEKQFTSDASHELRTPVSVILAECEYALGEEKPEEWRDSLEVISRQGRKMSEMIEELLTFTRMERGILKVQRDTVDFSAVVVEVCREQERIWEKDIKLTLESQQSVLVQGDEKLLARMVTNLISNAYKYGKEPGNIQVRLYRENGRIVLSVRDDGIGIRKEEIPLIWNRFYRADNARGDSTSTGLGLSMVQQIAKLHHAQTKVVSEIGIGSTFLIFF